MPLIHRLCLVILTLLFIVSCTSKTSASKVHGVFITSIKADGTKLFVFTSPDYGDSGKHYSHPGLAERQGRGRQGLAAREQLEKLIIRALDIRISENGYCREGYIELGSYIERGSFEIRGECNDTATQTDRKRF